MVYKPILDPRLTTLSIIGIALYIVLAPLYIFESGLPQPADIIILAVAVMVLPIFLLREQLTLHPVFTSLGIMVALFAIINAIYGLHLGDVRFLYPILYYGFNAALFCTVIIVCRAAPDDTIRYVRLAFIIAIAWQVAWVMIGPASIDRTIGSFNNPNQLGYWAVLSAASLLILNHGRRLPLIDGLTILICGVLIFESLSRAAIVSAMFLAFYMLLSRSIPALFKIGSMAIGLLTTMIYVTLIPSSTEFFTQRMNILAIDNVGVIAERGYQRLWDFPHYMIFGAGEGAYWRFMDVRYAGRTSHGGLEIHSGLATILFSYGVLGLALFSTFIINIFRRIPPIMWLSLVAVMAYSLTHQGFRFTGFWLYLSLVYGITRYSLPKEHP